MTRDTLQVLVLINSRLPVSSRECKKNAKMVLILCGSKCGGLGPACQRRLVWAQLQAWCVIEHTFLFLNNKVCQTRLALNSCSKHHPFGLFIGIFLFLGLLLFIAKMVLV